MSANRVHVVIPKGLVDEIDAIVGQRHRRSFMCEAAKEKLKTQKQGEAIRKFADSLSDEDYPEWKNGSAAWVHNLRQEDDRIREERLRPSSGKSSSRHQRPYRRTGKKTRTR